ncbi:MAG: uracil-DNA glycosylase [Desulfocapsa sp.]|nr:uracil-DNA glycosylase [Desulfocapsa sp.]
MEKEKEIVQLLHDIRGVLACHQASSIAEYPGRSGLSSFLDGCRLQVTSGSPGAPITEENNRSAGTASVTKKSDLGSLAEIAAEVEQCTSCALAARRSCGVSGRGRGDKVRLFVIGHWLTVTEQSSPEAVFGKEEDLMLERMLAAIHLPMEEVFVTNVIKCGVGPDIQPQAEHLDACASYLRRQITAAAPELICTMGMVATKTLLQRSQPLSRLRGRFYTYRGAEGLEIPLLPTFHPGYLVRNPEMKKATWLDLQALEKYLEK